MFSGGARSAPDDFLGGDDSVRARIMHSYTGARSLQPVATDPEVRKALEVLDAQRRADFENPPAYSPSTHLTQAVYRGFRRSFLEPSDDPMKFKFGSMGQLRMEFSKLERDPSLEVIGRLFDFARFPVVTPNGRVNEVLSEKVRNTPSERLAVSFRYQRSYVESARSTLHRILKQYPASSRGSRSSWAVTNWMWSHVGS